jgi:hypothetical protein
MGISIQAYTCPWNSLSFNNGKTVFGVHPIIVGTSYISPCYHTLCFLFHYSFSTHSPPNQFGVVIKRGCEEVVHGINAPLISILIGCSHKLMLPMHFNVLHVVMLSELQVIRNDID